MTLKFSGPWVNFPDLVNEEASTPFLHSSYCVAGGVLARNTFTAKRDNPWFISYTVSMQGPLSELRVFEALSTSVIRHRHTGNRDMEAHRQ